ncbi:alpha/beta hydrolase [Desulfuromonas versatilis]|nr:alpha/beta hydrolase [Desulfuromonas versatilis]
MNNTLYHAPSSTTPWLLPGAIKAHYQIKMPLLFPPVIVNLREDRTTADPAARDLLSIRELDYFRNNGNNATIFIHGFNVPYGDFGRQVNAVNQPKVISCTSGERPVLDIEYGQAATIFRDLSSLGKRFPLLQDARFAWPSHFTEEELNGQAAHSWVVNLEDGLNRAAGFNRHDYSKFTRLIHVAWSGDVFQLNYIHAELHANRAGAKLARLIQQLVDAGIRINIIAHSLGNRVLLVAMNLLGQMPGRKECIDNVFMWQPAVPDTALSNDPSKDTSVMRNWNFIHANRTAKTIMVLYSQQDNILGPHRNDQDRQRDRDNLTEAAAGRVGGLYTLAQATGVPLATEIDKDMLFAPWGIQGLYLSWQKNFVGDSLDSFEKALMEEINQDRDGLFTDHLRILDYEKALPLAYVLRVRQQMVEDYMKTLRALGKMEISARMPRPAMGYGGPMRFQNDNFVESLIGQGKIVLVDQTQWLFNHSGMKVPSKILFEEVYRKRILLQILRTSGFGKY